MKKISRNRMVLALGGLAFATIALVGAVYRNETTVLLAAAPIALAFFNTAMGTKAEDDHEKGA